MTQREFIVGLGSANLWLRGRSRAQPIPPPLLGRADEVIE